MKVKAFDTITSLVNAINDMGLTKDNILTILQKEELFFLIYEIKR